MVLIGIGLCLIGIGIIYYGIVISTHSARIPRFMPKGKPAGQYESDMKWDFPED